MAMSRPGQMRHRITVQRNTETVNPATGVRSSSWADLYVGVPAAIRSLTSRELQAASARQSESSVEFELRAGLDINADDRIVFDGDVYDIEPPTFDETRQRRMKIKAARNLTNG